VLCAVQSETAACVLCVVQSETAACVLCAVQSETAACVLCAVQSESRVSLCTAHKAHASLQHAATSPNLYNDVFLPSVLTKI